MKIDHLQLPEITTKSLGIDPIDLKRLGTVIALVGKNGAGKSRILELLEKEYLKKLNISSYINDEITEIPQILQTLVNEYKEANELLGQLQKPTESLVNLQTQLKNFRNKVQRSPSNQSYKTKIADIGAKISMLEVFEKNLSQKNEIESIINSKTKKYYYKIEYSEIRQLQDVLESVTIEDITFEQLFESVADQEEYSELGSIYKTGLTYLAKLPNQLIDDSLSSVGDFEKFQQKSSLKRFNSLKKYIEIFLKKNLTWDRLEIQKTVTSKRFTIESQGLWKLDGRDFNYKEFSDGEKTLFAFSLLFFLLEQNPRLKIQESIIIIDEPELHLHPEAEMLVIEGIRNIIKDKGQLWIATHSVNILSTLFYDEIFMVKEGKIISPSRTTPGDSFIELMGLTGYVEKLIHFITDISNWAFLNFIVQCFNEPEVIRTAKEDDPEIEVFKRSLKENENKTLLLDFGAGKGRVFRALSKDNLVINAVEYYAFDPEIENYNELQSLNLKMVYKDYSELPSSAFDYILLCNVLHEIKIEEWIDTLSKLKSSLSENGYLIIIEDLKLPKGEKIGTQGFIILDSQSLKTLFTMQKEPIEIIPSDKRYTNRVQCTVIKKEDILEINARSINDALQILMQNTIEKIKKIRNDDVNSQNQLSYGRELAFYSQLYINALFAKQYFQDKMII